MHTVETQCQRYIEQLNTICFQYSTLPSDYETLIKEPTSYYYYLQYLIGKHLKIPHIPLDMLKLDFKGDLLPVANVGLQTKDASLLLHSLVSTLVGSAKIAEDLHTLDTNVMNKNETKILRIPDYKISYETSYLDKTYSISFDVAVVYLLEGLSLKGVDGATINNFQYHSLGLITDLETETHVYRNSDEPKNYTSFWLPLGTDTVTYVDKDLQPIQLHGATFQIDEKTYIIQNT